VCVCVCVCVRVCVCVCAIDKNGWREYNAVVPLWGENTLLKSNLRMFPLLILANLQGYGISH